MPSPSFEARSITTSTGTVWPCAVRAPSSNDADRTWSSRLDLSERKLPASTDTTTVEAATGSATSSSLEAIVNVAFTAPRPNIWRPEYVTVERWGSTRYLPAAGTASDGASPTAITASLRLVLPAKLLGRSRCGSSKVRGKRPSCSAAVPGDVVGCRRAVLAGTALASPAPPVSGSAHRSDIGRPSDDDPYAGYAGRERSDVVWVGGHHHGGITRRADRDDMSIGERLTAAPRCVQHSADELGQPLVGRHDPNALAISVPSQRSLYSPSPCRSAAHLGKDHRGGLRLTPALGSAAKQRTQSGPRGGVEDVKGTGIEHDRRAHAAPLVLWPRSISFNNRSAAAISAGLGEPCFWSSSSSQRSNASR